MRYWELLNEDEIKALSAFINKWGKEDLPLPVALARATARRNTLATARVLAKGQQHWAQLLKAAGKTHGPVPANTRPLAAPRKPTAAAARYTSSGVVPKPAQSP